ncbi:MAG: hypothetical protein WDN24_06555 [Sphingomonas sp.]
MSAGGGRRARGWPQRLSVACALLLLLAVAPARAQIEDLDLGARPASAATADGTMPQRQAITIGAYACSDESEFERKIDEARKTGDWPILYLVAKAAWAAYYQEPCRRDIELIAADDDSRGTGSFDGLLESVNARYARAYGPACASVASAPARSASSAQIRIELSAACLVAQVRKVIEDPEHGAWKIADGKRIPRYPGTSADKLPCITDWLPGRSFMISGAEGDWDMGVTDYTRLAHMLYRAVGRDGALAADGNAALEKLNRDLLTIRGEPARETYDIFFSCGNKANSFGSAKDYLDDDDTYDEAQQRAVAGKDVGDRSFWEKLWKLLRFLAVLAAAAFAVGAILGGAAGLFAGLAAAGAVVGAAAIIIAFTTLWVAGIEETENHLLMQNSAKYLKNKLMMEELRAQGDEEGFEEIAEENEDVREWLLERLARIAEEDFVEYNSKPYSRLSHAAILNLVDFGCYGSWDWAPAPPPLRGAAPCHAKDKSLVTAGLAILDLTAAKLGLGTNEGRRIIPFRRLAKANTTFVGQYVDDRGQVVAPRHFHDMGSEADNLLAALQFWTGNTRHGPKGHASGASIGQMLLYATSRYRPHPMLLDLAIDKSVPYEQELNYEGHERYSSGPGWLITAGGERSGYAQGLRMNLGALGLLGVQFTLYVAGPTDDKGVAVPTTLIATGGDRRRDTGGDFLRFEGSRDIMDADSKPIIQSFSNNRCVTGSFACGLRFEIPEPIAKCLSPAGVDAPAAFDLSFLSSSECDEFRDNDQSPGNDFFLAVWKSTCRARSRHPECDERGWGFFEVARKSAFGTLDNYRNAFIARNRDRFLSWNQSFGTKEIEFWSVTQNRLIRFKPSDEDFDSDCRACGGVIDHESGARFNVRNPRLQGRIFIDFDDPMNPVRSRRRGSHACGSLTGFWSRRAWPWPPARRRASRSPTAPRS